MLQLLANNHPLDIDKINFNITRRSPIKADNNGSFIYSVTLPYSDTNAVIFGFPLRLQRKDRQRIEVKGEIRYNGHIIQSGVWRAKTTDNRSISLEMLIDAGAFADSIENKKLPDLFDVPVSVPDIVAHVNSQVTKTWPEVNYNFPVIYNPEFYGDPKETDPQKNPNLQFEGFLNNYKNGFITNVSLNRNTASPQLYLGYIFEKIFEQAGYRIKGKILDDTMFKAAMIYNNLALDRLLATTFAGDFSGSTSSPDFVVIWNQNLNDPGSLYNSSTGEYQAKIAGDYQLKIPVTYTRNENYDFVMSVEYNGIAIATEIIPRKVGDNSQDSFEMTVNYSVAEPDAGSNFIVKAWFTDNTTKYSVLLNAASINIVNTTQPLANILKVDFNFKDLVPDIPVKEFLKAVYQGFGMLPFFQEETRTVTLLSWDELLKNSNASEILKENTIRNTLKISSNNYQGIKAIFNFQGPDSFNNDGKTKENLGTVMRWLDYPSVTLGDVYFIESLNAYYQRQYNKDTENFEVNAIGDLQEPTIKDDGKQSMTFDLAPMHMRCPQSTLYAYRNLPSLSAKGTSEAYNIRNKFPLRIMFWAGITAPNGLTTDTYPLATTTKYDTSGNIVLPINWKTEEILNRYYSQYLEWIKRREKVEFSQILSSSEWKNILLQSKFDFQNSLIILEEIYMKISFRQFGPAKITGWTT